MHSKSVAHRLAFVAIALLALGLRLWHLELTTFGSDEAVLLLLAEDMVRQGVIPLSGPLSSIGLSTPPHYLYLISPVVAVARDPVVTAGALAVVGTAAVVITMVIGWRAFSPIVGLLGGLLFAVNPIAVEYSRRIWQPGPLLVLGALLLLALDLGVINRRPTWAAASFPIATLGTLLHTSVAPLLPLLCAPLFILISMRRWLSLAIGLAASAVLVAPFVLYEFQFNWKDYPNFRYYSSLHSFLNLDAPHWTVAITTGWGLPNHDVVPAPQRALPQGVLDVGADVALALLALGIIVAIAELARRQGSASTRIRLAGLLLWLALPTVLSIRHWYPLYLHYFFGLLPVACLLMGLPFARWTRIAQPLVLTGTLVVASVETIGLIGGTAYVASAAATDPCFSLSISASRAAALELAQFGHGKNADTAVLELDTGDTKAIAYLLRADFPDVYIPHPVASSQTPKLFGNIGLHRTLPSQSLSADGAHIAPLLTSTSLPEVSFRNGITLHEVRFSAESSQQYLRLATNWSVEPSATSNHPVVWQVTLQTADGHTLQADSGDSALPADLSGHSLVSWFTIDSHREIAPDDRPAGEYQLALELIDTFAAPPGPVAFTDAQGNDEYTLRFPVHITEPNRCPYSMVVA